MRLDRLLHGVEILGVRGDPVATEVTGITHDSRAARPGTLFCCLRGAATDGHFYAAAAVDSGATALLVERNLPLQVAQVRVADARATMAPLAAAFWDHPSRRLSVVGVTGTNGKTTTTHLLQSVLEGAGRPCGLIGTLSGARTTPEATDLQRQLAGFVDADKRAVAMEVSSHALVQHRVDATWFSVAVFTNLGRDHLDYHRTMEEYFRAKARLFEPDLAAAAVVNADDAHGRLLLDAARIPTTAFSLADAADLDVGPTSSRFRWRGRPVELRLGGVFNVSNALGAAAAAHGLGVDDGAIAEGLSAAAAVPGRFEAVDVDRPFSVIVDYAHTPDGLEQVLRAARRAASGGRVIVVFGCGGDRDRSKRPQMGDVATRLADVAVLTSDNPRREDPLTIIDEVRAGVTRHETLVVEPDRRAAIGVALHAAHDGDVVVIAGKGHETGQVIGEQVLPFDDRVVARELAGASA